VNPNTTKGRKEVSSQKRGEVKKTNYGCMGSQNKKRESAIKLKEGGGGNPPEETEDPPQQLERSKKKKIPQRRRKDGGEGRRLEAKKGGALEKKNKLKWEGVEKTILFGYHRWRKRCVGESRFGGVGKGGGEREQ